jgi:Replication-relaxation
VIDRLPRRVGGVRGGSSSIVYGLGPAGVRLLVRSGHQVHRLGTPGDRYVAHTLAIAELVVRLHETGQAGELDLLALETEPECWRTYPRGFGARAVLKPDLFLRIGIGAYEDRWFVEVDLATEATATIQAKAARYLEHFRSGLEQRHSGVYPRVIWTVPDPRRCEQIEVALSRLPEAARRLFVVWPFEEVVGRLSAEAHI